MRALVEMANAGTLYLTDCLAQPEPIRTYVGDCLLGYNVDAQTHLQKQGEFIPHELASYRVRVVSIPHMVQTSEEKPDGSTLTRFEEQSDVPITFRMGSEVVDEAMTYDAAKQHLDVWSDTVRVKPRYVETGRTDTTLTLQEAVWCLRQHGENVKRARSRRLQRRCWRVREVRPGQEPQQAKRGPGRPRKEEASDANA